MYSTNSPHQSLKSITSRKELAVLLGFKPKALTYTLFHQPEKYRVFQIPKKRGGYRTIASPCPSLKNLQRQLAKLLYACREEIDKVHKLKPASYGYKEGLSIVSHAQNHKNRRFVLNVDLEDFFPSIDFGRVRGYFLKNRDFQLSEPVATTIAQIACNDGSLPQGSPCSPVISDLIGHLLDVRMLQISKRHKVTYSRYADDLTFSTNQKNFPVAISTFCDKSAKWTVGSKLEKSIIKCRFSVNPSKTRMQFRDSRQTVTGLVVNKKVNVRFEYYRLVRAMCHSLFTRGYYTVPEHIVIRNPKVRIPIDNEAKEITNTKILRGMLGFIFFVKESADDRPEKERKKSPYTLDLYTKFLKYDNFISLDKPLIISEGKTDVSYLKIAIRQLNGNVDGIPTKSSDLAFFNHSKKTSGFLGFKSGGGSNLKNFVVDYSNLLKQYKHIKMQHPIIILADNDSGCLGLFNLIGEKYKTKITLQSTSQYYQVTDNLFLVKTPEKDNGKETKIEDLFENIILKTKLGGKSLSLVDKSDNNKFYSKQLFVDHVIRPNQENINFNAFIPLLKRISKVVSDYTSPEFSKA